SAPARAELGERPLPYALLAADEVGAVSVPVAHAVVVGVLRAVGYRGVPVSAGLAGSAITRSFDPERLAPVRPWEGETMTGFEEFERAAAVGSLPVTATRPVHWSFVPLV